MIYAVTEAAAAQTNYLITNLKKMKGFKAFYRIKLGDYRIGFELINKNTVYFVAVSHRKDIYKTFP
jgi:mRNA interferase RelE/StbE